MAGWSGFTDEDLRKMRSLSNEGNNDEKRHAPSKRGMVRQSKPAVQRQRVKKPAQKVENNQSLQVQETKNNEGHNEEQKSSQEKVTESEAVKDVEEDKSAATEVTELSSDQALSMERDNVAKFQQQQKVIEEANKQKRALLSKAIEERRKMAKAESEKLVKIQRELNHLDTLLNVDVGIIRDKIEIASLDYVQAQKRYERAEKEFIESKMDLYEKSEAKERLTEHLYTIINQNEIRKAKKLVELMEQLAMKASPEEMELTISAIPQLTNFTAASTFHHPGVQRSESEIAEDGNCKKKEEGEGNSEEIVANKGDETDTKVGEKEAVVGKKADGNSENKNSSLNGEEQSPLEHSSQNNDSSSEHKISDQKSSVNDTLSSGTDGCQQKNDTADANSIIQGLDDQEDKAKTSVPGEHSPEISSETSHPQSQNDGLDNSLHHDNSNVKDDSSKKMKGWSSPFT